MRKIIWISILQKFGERSLEVPCAHSGATISGLKQLDADQETSVARFCGVTEHVQEDLFSHDHRAGETLQGWVESQLLPGRVQFASVDVVGVLASEKKEKERCEALISHELDSARMHDSTRAYFDGKGQPRPLRQYLSLRETGGAGRIQAKPAL